MNYDKNSIKKEWLDGKLDHEFIDWAEDFGKYLAEERSGKRGTELNN